jgi:hypothetical protein
MNRRVGGARAAAVSILTLGLALAAASALAAAKLKPADVELIAEWIGGVYDTAPVAGAAARSSA